MCVGYEVDYKMNYGRCEQLWTMNMVAALCCSFSLQVL